jgi:hypothetical protein
VTHESRNICVSVVRKEGKEKKFEKNRRKQTLMNLLHEPQRTHWENPSVGQRQQAINFACSHPQHYCFHGSNPFSQKGNASPLPPAIAKL